jgi:adenylate cyclase class 2
VGTENEVKFEVKGFAALRDRLDQLQAKCLGSAFERNLVLDTPAGSLRSEGKLLRIRQAGDVQTLCLKSGPGREGQEGFKAREEWETGFSDWEAMQEILEGLGFSCSFAYEKVRESWRLDGCHICLDLLPFGRFVEIEGPAEELFACAARLGLDRREATAKTYHELNRDRRGGDGGSLDPSFTFSEPERSQLIENQKSMG